MLIKLRIHILVQNSKQKGRVTVKIEQDGKQFLKSQNLLFVDLTLNKFV